MAETADTENTPPERLPSTRALNGNRLTSLRALRKLLSISIREAQPHQRAQLAKQLRETNAEIDGLTMPKRFVEPPEERDEIDELAKRRALRRGDPTAS